MTPALLQSARRSCGWTQKRAARQLGVTQAYLSMLECGRRVPPPALVMRLAKVYSLSPVSLPLPAGDWQPPTTGDREIADELARLSYPGLSRRGGAATNPAIVLLTALSLADLNRSLLQTLPWLFLRYPEMDTSWLLDRAKRLDLQNRLGFIVSVAREVREARGEAAAPSLVELEAALERSRLARFSTLCQDSMSEEEGRWLFEHRSDLAQRWNLLTDIKAEDLPYAAEG